jgi:predicted component of type VI protein secretion system
MAMNSSFLSGESLRGGGMMGIEVPQKPMPQPSAQLQPAFQQQPAQPVQSPPQPQEQARKMDPKIVEHFSEAIKGANSISDIENIAKEMNASGIPSLKVLADGLLKKLQQEQAAGKTEEQIVADFKSAIDKQPDKSDTAEG